MLGSLLNKAGAGLFANDDAMIGPKSHYRGSCIPGVCVALLADPPIKISLQIPFLDATADDLAEVILTDLATTARVLRLPNSAFCGSMERPFVEGL